MLTPEQITARRAGLGGSDLAAALGLNRWRTPFEVWLEKTGRTEPFGGNLQTRFGSHAEDFVAAEYTATSGRRVQRYRPMLRHPTAPILGHIDRLVIPEGAKVASHRGEIRTDRGLECKTASAFAAGRDDEWGEPGTDAVPQSYLVQCAAYMALTGCPHWDLAVLFGNQEFRVYHLDRDPELEELLIEEASRWWRNHVIADTPPDPQSETEARIRWAAHRPGLAVEVDEDTAEELRALARVKAEIRRLETEERELRDRIIPRIGEAETVTRNGLALATFRANRSSQRTDWQALAGEYARWLDDEDAERIRREHTITPPGARVLRLAKEIAP